MNWWWGPVALAVCWIAAVGGWTYADARRLGAPQKRSLRLALAAILSPARYWWGARLILLPRAEQERLLTEEAARLGLSRVDSVRCPLCGAEIERAWTIDDSGRLAVRPGPVSCPQCDFRLDACRHCRHFQPGGAANSLGGVADYTHGSCGVHKRSQPVEDFCTPGMARQLRARGYDYLSGPAPILDSYLPLSGCRSFALDERRLRASGVRRPGLRQRGLLRLLAMSGEAEDEGTSPELPSSEEQWLL